MQSIGVVLGKVESKPVNTELRFYGMCRLMNGGRPMCRRDSRDGFAKSMRRNGQFYWQRSALVHDLQSRPGARPNTNTCWRRRTPSLCSRAKERGCFRCVFSLRCCKERLLQWEVSPAEIEKLDQGGKALTDLTAILHAQKCGTT